VYPASQQQQITLEQCTSTAHPTAVDGYRRVTKNKLASSLRSRSVRANKTGIRELDTESVSSWPPEQRCKPLSKKEYAKTEYDGAKEAMFEKAMKFREQKKMELEARKYHEFREAELAKLAIKHKTTVDKVRLNKQ